MLLTPRTMKRLCYILLVLKCTFKVVMANKLQPLNTTWHHAYAACKEKGLDLPTVQTRSDIQQTGKIMAVKGLPSVWSALRKTDSSNWKRLDGSTINFTYWGPGEPHDNISCVVISQSGNEYKLFSKNCSSAHGWVCASPKEPNQEGMVLIISLAAALLVIIVIVGITTSILIYFKRKKSQTFEIQLAEAQDDPLIYDGRKAVEKQKISSEDAPLLQEEPTVVPLHHQDSNHRDILATTRNNLCNTSNSTNEKVKVSCKLESKHTLPSAPAVLPAPFSNQGKTSKPNYPETKRKLTEFQKTDKVLHKPLRRTDDQTILKIPLLKQEPLKTNNGKTDNNTTDRISREDQDRATLPATGITENGIDTESSHLANKLSDETFPTGTSPEPPHNIRHTSRKQHIEEVQLQDQPQSASLMVDQTVEDSIQSTELKSDSTEPTLQMSQESTQQVDLPQESDVQVTIQPPEVEDETRNDTDPATDIQVPEDKSLPAGKGGLEEQILESDTTETQVTDGGQPQQETRQNPNASAGADDLNPKIYGNPEVDSACGHKRPVSIDVPEAHEKPPTEELESKNEKRESDSERTKRRRLAIDDGAPQQDTREVRSSTTPREETNESVNKVNLTVTDKEAVMTTDQQDDQKILTNDGDENVFLGRNGTTASEENVVEEMMGPALLPDGIVVIPVSICDETLNFPQSEVAVTIPEGDPGCHYKSFIQLQIDASVIGEECKETTGRVIISPLVKVEIPKNFGKHLQVHIPHRLKTKSQLQQIQVDCRNKEGEPFHPMVSKELVEVTMSGVIVHVDKPVHMIATCPRAFLTKDGVTALVWATYWEADKIQFVQLSVFLVNDLYTIEDYLQKIIDDNAMYIRTKKALGSAFKVISNGAKIQNHLIAEHGWIVQDDTLDDSSGQSKVQMLMQSPTYPIGCLAGRFLIRRPIVGVACPSLQFTFNMHLIQDERKPEVVCKFREEFGFPSR